MSTPIIFIIIIALSQSSKPSRTFCFYSEFIIDWSNFTADANMISAASPIWTVIMSRIFLKVNHCWFDHLVNPPSSLLSPPSPLSGAIEAFWHCQCVYHFDWNSLHYSSPLCFWLWRKVIHLIFNSSCFLLTIFHRPPTIFIVSFEFDPQYYVAAVIVFCGTFMQAGVYIFLR